MKRIHGLDLARALAIIGMIIAHTGPETFLTRGFPSVLFAVLSGVSIGIIARSSRDDADARFRLMVRAVLLLGIGLLLAAIQPVIVIVLTAIGVSYLLLLPVLRWSTRRLMVLLVGLVLLGPLIPAAQHTLNAQWANQTFADLLFGSYPLTAWVAYTLLGLLIHRLWLHRPTWLLLGGLATFGLTQLVIRATPVAGGPGEVAGFPGAWLQGTPHSGGLFDVLTSAGLSVAVIAACLLACHAAAIVTVTYPFRAFGAMSLTLYVAHVLVTTAVTGTFIGTGQNAVVPPAPVAGGAVPGVELQPGDPLPPGVDPTQIPGLDSGLASGLASGLDSGDPGADIPFEDPLWPGLFLGQLIVFLIFASLWRRRFRRGPAEWAMSRVVTGTVTDGAVGPVRRAALV